MPAPLLMKHKQIFWDCGIAIVPAYSLPRIPARFLPIDLPGWPSACRAWPASRHCGRFRGRNGHRPGAPEMTLMTLSGHRQANNAVP